MGIGVSIFLLAAGAILSFAVETNAEGVDLDTIGLILMLIGGLGLLFSLLMFNDWAPRRERRHYVDDDVVTRRRVVDVEEPVVRQSIVEEEPVVRSRTVTRRRSHR